MTTAISSKTLKIIDENTNIEIKRAFVKKENKYIREKSRNLSYVFFKDFLIFIFCRMTDRQTK